METSKTVASQIAICEATIVLKVPKLDLKASHWPPLNQGRPTQEGLRFWDSQLRGMDDEWVKLLLSNFGDALPVSVQKSFQFDPVTGCSQRVIADIRITYRK